MIWSEWHLKTADRFQQHFSITAAEQNYMRCCRSCRIWKWHQQSWLGHFLPWMPCLPTADRDFSAQPRMSWAYRCLLRKKPKSAYTSQVQLLQWLRPQESTHGEICATTPDRNTQLLPKCLAKPTSSKCNELYYKTIHKRHQRLQQRVTLVSEREHNKRDNVSH